MKRRLLLFALFWIVAVGLCACGNDGTSDLPKGVRETADGLRYYAIAFNGGEDALNYFTMIGKKTEISVHFTDGSSNMNNVGIVRYCKVKEGGWIAYKGYTRILYFPDNIPADRIKNLCMGIARQNENFMTIEEAKEYIPFLNN